MTIVKKILYFDYQASTPTDKQVIKAMQPYWETHFANPHAVHHICGSTAGTAVEKAREQIASIIGANPNEIIFTSGATEANNLALRGVMPNLIKKNKNHIITSVIEHNSILQTCKYLEKTGVKVTYLPVNENGIIDIELIKNAITNKTALVSIMAVNNEIGTIQPTKKIGEICKNNNILFHVDAVQAIGKIPFNVETNNVDMISISAHKMYGPKGIGALYIKRNSRIIIEPIILGGAQEKGLRSGTLPTPLCAGFGEACLIASKDITAENKNIAELRNNLLEKLQNNLSGVYLNGDKTQRIAGNLNINIAGVKIEDLKNAWENKLVVSFGSACSSGRRKASHVISAINGNTCGTSVRLGIGRLTTAEDIASASDIIIDTVKKLRKNLS